MEYQRPLLEAKNLSKEFSAASGFWKKNKDMVHAVTDVSLSIYEGETLGLVGESGCGKSTLGRLLLSLIPPTRGEVIFDGQNLNALSKEKLRAMRRQMQMIFQDPCACLNPRLFIRDIVAEPLKTHGLTKNKKEETALVRKLLSQCGVPPEFLYRYPHQLSGGQRQRVSIARAIALNPRLIVCDEPVSALDVSIQAQILNLLKDLQEAYKLTYLFISHDLSVIRYLSDRVCVMFLGKICELGSTQRVYESPLHPYTRFLLSAVSLPDPSLRQTAKPILTGEPPSPLNPPSGCYFRTRCPYAHDKCASKAPILREAAPQHMVACHL